MAAEFPNILGFQEKLELFLYRDGTMTMARVLLGAVLGMVMGSGAGALMVGLIGAGMVGLTALAHMGIERAKKRVLTDFYRDEIAAILGKPTEQVTPQDLLAMAMTPDQGGRGSYALKAAIEDFGHVRNFFIASQAITAVIMTVGLAVLSAVFPGMPAIALAGVSSLLYNELFNTVQTTGEVLTDINKGTITREIRAISDQIGLGGRISSTRVFNVFVRADAKLGEAIRKRCGIDYEALSITAKRELVRDYDPVYHIYQVTQDINYGHINPTELAFLAYGQQSGVPRRQQALSPFKGLESEGKEICAPENGRIVCRGGSDAALVPDGAYDMPSLHDRIMETSASSLDTPGTEPASVFTPRDLFHTEQERYRRLQDPFKALQ